MSGAQRRAQAVRLGALMAELEKSFHTESSCEKELRALEHQVQHLGTILKVRLRSDTEGAEATAP